MHEVNVLDVSKSRS